MLSYEKDIIPIKITAREAHNRSVGTEQDYLKLLVDIYDLIGEEMSEPNTHCHYWIDSYYLANRVFRELTRQGYNVSLDKDICADKEWHLLIDWEKAGLDPNKKYILPMDDATSWEGEFYYAAIVNDHWSIAKAFTDTQIIAGGYTVTAKDIEDAPEWVKVIEPVEVD